MEPIFSFLWCIEVIEHFSFLLFQEFLFLFASKHAEYLFFLLSPNGNTKILSHSFGSADWFLVHRSKSELVKKIYIAFISEIYNMAHN